MSEICTNCGGQTATGCWLCNNDNFPGANQYADPLDKSYWLREAGRLAAENAYLTQRIAELDAKVERLQAASAEQKRIAAYIEEAHMAAKARAEAAEALCQKQRELLDEWEDKLNAQEALFAPTNSPPSSPSGRRKGSEQD